MRLLAPFAVILTLGCSSAMAQAQIRQAGPQSSAIPYPSAAGSAGLGPVSTPLFRQATPAPLPPTAPVVAPDDIPSKPLPFRQ
jgi:hypothetical protein